jgi:hypothetical protein
MPTLNNPPVQTYGQFLDNLFYLDEKPKGCEECPICLVKWENGTGFFVETSCKHVFEKDCLLEWLRTYSKDDDRNTTCPMCRAVLFFETQDDSVDEQDSDDEVEEYGSILGDLDLRSSIFGDLDLRSLKYDVIRPLVQSNIERCMQVNRLLDIIPEYFRQVISEFIAPGKFTQLQGWIGTNIPGPLRLSSLELVSMALLADVCIDLDFWSEFHHRVLCDYARTRCYELLNWGQSLLNRDKLRCLIPYTRFSFGTTEVFSRWESHRVFQSAILVERDASSGQEVGRQEFTDDRTLNLSDFIGSFEIGQYSYVKIHIDIHRNYFATVFSESFPGFLDEINIEYVDHETHGTITYTNSQRRTIEVNLKYSSDNPEDNFEPSLFEEPHHHS